MGAALALALSGSVFFAFVPGLGVAATTGSPGTFAASSAGSGIHTSGAASATPADLFIRSVVLRDGALGWKQLCSALRTQLPQDQLSLDAQAQKASDAAQGITLSADFVGARSLPEGGQLRYYLLTAHARQGVVGERTYVVHTGTNGCVTDVRNI